MCLGWCWTVTDRKTQGLISLFNQIGTIEIKILRTNSPQKANQEQELCVNHNMFSINVFFSVSISVSHSLLPSALFSRCTPAQQHHRDRAGEHGGAFRHWRARQFPQGLVDVRTNTKNTTNREKAEITSRVRHSIVGLEKALSVC